MAVVVALGATGFTGLQTREASASGGGYRMELLYPRIARAGLDITWRVTVERPGGFPTQRSIVLAVTGDYFDIFETQGFYPQPYAETRDSHWCYIEFHSRRTGPTRSSSTSTRTSSLPRSAAVTRPSGCSWTTSSRPGSPTRHSLLP